MKTLELHLPDDVLSRLDKVAEQQGNDYTSVNTDEVKGRDALVVDLLVLGLDAIDAGEEEFAD